MKIYPAIDLKDGKCVRLVQGDYDAVTVYDSDPAAVAKKWQEMGASYLHVVDLDGAKEGRGINDGTVAAIVAATTSKVELGGGIRSMEDITNKLALGLDRVILGSVALKNKPLVAEAIKRFGPEKIVVGVDAKGGMVAVEGWLEVSDVSAISFCQELVALGVTTVIYTDIAKDGMMQGPNVQETQALIAATGLKVVGSGGVSTLSDVAALKAIGVDGVIIGKAIYNGAIDLSDAVALESNAL